MTYEDVRAIRENHTSVDCDNEELARMIDAAIEKQIPKKPIININSYTSHLCPFCGKAVGVWVVEHTEVIKNGFCGKCGQKLDWSDTE